jgi:Flp pilus assembly protein TadB
VASTLKAPIPRKPCVPTAMFEAERGERNSTTSGRWLATGLVALSSKVHVVPKWLPQFLFPLLLVLVVVLGVTFGAPGIAVILLILVAALLVWRLRDLKSHPPDPELVSKPFWKF